MHTGHTTSYVLLSTFCFLREHIDSGYDYLERVIIEIQVTDRGERKPLRIDEAAAAPQFEVGEGGFGEEVAHPLALLAAFDLRVVGDILVDAELLHYFDIEPHFLFYLADSARLDIFALFNLPLRERPMAKDVVDEREVRLAFRARVDDRARQMLGRHLRGLLPDILARAALIFARLAELDIDGAQDAVDEPPRRRAAEGLRELYRFVDGDLRGNLRTVGEEEFGKTEPQYIAVDGCNAVYRPLGRRAYDDFVYFFLFGDGGLEEVFHERHIGIARAEFLAVVDEPRERFVARHLSPRRVALEEHLENNGTSKVSICHNYKSCFTKKYTP